MMDNKKCQADECMDFRDFYRISIGRLSLCYKKQKTGKIKSQEIDRKIDDLSQRMTSTKDDEVVKYIFELSKTIFEYEHTRTVHLDTKGTSLLAVSGASASMFITICSLFLKYLLDLQIHFEKYQIIILIGFYFLCILLLLRTIGSCIFVTRVRKSFKMMSDEDVFNEIEIQQKLERYQRFMSTVYWKFFLNNYQINNEKANLLLKAQIFFFLSIVLIFFMLSFFGFIIMTN